MDKTGIPRTNSIGKVFGAGMDVTNNMPNSEEAILKGEYAVIRSLIRVLEVIQQITLHFYFQAHCIMEFIYVVKFW